MQTAPLLLAYPKMLTVYLFVADASGRLYICNAFILVCLLVHPRIVDVMLFSGVIYLVQKKSVIDEISCRQRRADVW